MAQPSSDRTEEKWYALSPEESLARLNVKAEAGLSTAEATQRQTRYGKNELPVAEGESFLKRLIEQFKDPTVLLLVIAAFISIAIDEPEDAVVITMIVVLNAAISIYQEQQAENALAALSKMQTPVVKVRRDGGKVEEISASDLVPGDIVLLEAGSSAPADGRLLTAVNVKVDEAAMTGESHAVDKTADTLPANDPPPALADRTNMVYMGTALTYGRAEMLVTDIGLQTQLGNIAALLQNVEKGRTPLQERLERVGTVLAVSAVTVCVIVFIVGLLRGNPASEMFITAVSLAVAAVPEGLPAVITIALALGANRMIKRNALIRKLPAVETLGSVTTICSDKTGTLTRNEMTATRIVLPNNQDISVSGVGYEPVGEFKEKRGELVHVTENNQLARMLEGAALCTDAHLEREGEAGKWKIIGDTTEGALIVMAMKQGWSRHELEGNLPRVNEIPFTSERKSMTTIHQPTKEYDTRLFNQAQYVSFTKGAPDNLLAWASAETTPEGHTPLTSERRQAWIDQIEQLASEGIRVLGVGYRTFDHLPAEITPETVERELVMLGLIGIVDPPRTEAMTAVQVAKGAGIRPMMITGDHKLTAKAIAQQIGIIPVSADARAIEGRELDQMTPQEMQETVKTVSVYARVSPEHKLRIVEALQKNGEIVAMTGDGVNDAPALKQANIGVAMGITGTDVSKGAADMVLTDDNFASIVSAVEEGRTIYDNIRKFLQYLMGSNTGEIIAMFGAIIIGFKLPLLATQILWVNMVTDGLPAIALGFEKGESDVMKRKPRHPKESIFARGLGVHILWAGAWMGICTLLGYIYMLNVHGAELFDPTEEHLEVARSMAFFVLAVTQLFHVTAIRAGHTAIWNTPLWENRLLTIAVVVTFFLQIGVLYFPPTQALLETTGLELQDLLVGTLLASSILPAIEVEKWLWRRREAEEAAALTV